MNMDRAYKEPLYLLKPTKKCLGSSLSPGLVFRILWYVVFMTVFLHIEDISFISKFSIDSSNFYYWARFLSHLQLVYFIVVDI